MKNLTVLAALGLAAIGSAQTNYLESPQNISLRLGYVYPVDARMRDVANSYIGVGVDFHTNLRLLEGASTSLSVDWFGKSGSGAKGNAFPIMVNQRWYTGDEYDPGRSYFFVGAGIAVVDITSTKTVLAGRVGYGKFVGENIFGELAFTYSDGANGARATALGFYLGYKF
ncbi:hypothetical protein QPK87_31855 [Kamptonema cortianum]|nr:hypothetical protein [Kamptonema cortianum]